MSWTLDSEEETEHFAKWIVRQFFAPGREPPEDAIVASIYTYFEEGGRDEEI